MSECPSSLTLERALRGELESSSSASWAPHVQSCSLCQARLQQMRVHEREFGVSWSARSIRLRRRTWFVALPAAAAVLAMVWLSSQDVLTAKGTGMLSTRVERNGVLVELSELTDGDHIQLVWSASSPTYVAVFGLEANGEKSVLFPENAQHAGWVDAGAGQPLGRSLVARVRLSGARLVAVSSHAPFAVAPIPTALLAGESVELTLPEIRP